MIDNIEEPVEGLFQAKTVSLKWGDDFLLMCDRKDQFPYAEKCLSYLDALPVEMEKRLRSYLLRYFRDFAAYCDAEEFAGWGEVNEDTIMEHIWVHSLIVDAECRRDRVEFHVEASCDWEPEHGLEITISDGKILYVGPFEDNGPNSSRLAYVMENYGYYDPDNDFSPNYADRE